MLQSSVGALRVIAGELSLYDKSISAAKVILTGFAVVFSMLFLLIIIIKSYSAIIAGLQRASDNRKKKKTKLVLEPVSMDKGVHIITKPAYVTPPTIDDDEIPEEVVAVIAAAVAATCGSSSKARIKSIKKASGGRSAWANAGVLDNTRPF